MDEDYMFVQEFCANAGNISSFRDFLRCAYGIERAKTLLSKSDESNDGMPLEEYRVLSERMHNAEQCLRQKALDYQENIQLFLRPVFSAKTEADFFRGMDPLARKDYLIERLEMADPTSTDYGYHLKEACKCLRQTPDLKTSQDPVIKPFVQTISRLEELLAQG